MTTSHRIIEILMAASLAAVGCAAGDDAVDQPIETAGAPDSTEIECDDGCGEPPAPTPTPPPPADDDGCDGGCDTPIALPDQRVDVSIEVIGTGVYLGLDLGCGGLIGAGEFRARFRGTGELKDGRIHITTVDALSARIETARGCPLEGITVGALASVRVQATIAADASLSIEGLARLTECGIDAASLLDIDVDLTFDRVIDGIGDTVCD